MDFYDIFKYITFFPTLILTVGIILGINFFTYLDTIHKCIFWYLVVMLIVDIGSWIYGRFISNNNLIILLLYSITEMLLFMWFYYQYLYRARHRLILILGLIAVLYILWEIINYDQTNVIQFQSYAKVVDDFVIMMLALTFFHEKINMFKDSKWSHFKLNIVILLFFSVNLIFFLPLNFLINESSMLKFYFWQTILLITIAFYLYLTYSIWHNARSRKKIKA